MKTRIVIGTDESGMFTIRKLLTLLMLIAVLSVTAQTASKHCTATTKAGQPCKQWAQKGSAYCYMHNPINHCEGKRKDGQPCNGLKVKGSKFCNAHQSQVK